MASSSVVVGGANRISVVEIDCCDDMSTEDVDRLFEELQYYQTVGTITLNTPTVPLNLHRFVSLDRLTLECADSIDCALLPRSISYLNIGHDSNTSAIKNLNRMANLVSLTVNRSQLLDAEPLLSVEHPLLQCIVFLNIGSRGDDDERLIKRFTFDLRKRIDLGLLFLGYKHAGNTYCSIRTQSLEK